MVEKTRIYRRPEARPYAVKDLLQLVQDGKTRLPDFQRPPRWRASHVLDLFDSIFRGFPVGELLFSKRPAEAGPLSFGSFHLQGAAMAEALFVVDGQQRLAALAGAMLHPEPQPRGDIHAIWFDLEEEEFQRSRVREPPPHWIPLNVTGHSFQLLQWLHAWPLRTERPDLVQRALSLGQRLQEYQIPAYIVEGASEEDLRLIFKRVNTSGVEMKEHEVFDALYGGTQIQRIPSACARLAQSGFGLIDAEWFLRCLKAVEGEDPRRSYTTGEETDRRPQPGAIERTEIALQRAFRFLTTDAGIPHIRLLPYALLPLVVLARFFHHHPQPHSRTKLLLARWVWRGALSEEHANSSNPAVFAHQQCIDHDESASLRLLLEKVPRQPELPDASTPWRLQSARTKLCALALLHLRPRDPATGKALDVEEVLAFVNEEEQELGQLFHDVFGQKQSSIADRVVLTNRQHLDLLANAPPEVLRSHAMDADAAAALREGNLDAFHRYRSSVLNPWLKSFFLERCAPDESDRPAIAHLMRQVARKATDP
jgi:hypothetical protein